MTITRSGIALAAALLAAAACANNPYVLTSDGAEAERKLFRYGDYCGAGNPTQAAPPADRAARLDTLAAAWPPVDELDALCFGHDVCYETLGHDDKLCDTAFANALTNYFDTFKGANLAACRNLAADMETAFRYKGAGNLVSFGGQAVSAIRNQDLSILTRDRNALGRAAARNTIMSYPEAPGSCSASPGRHDFDAALAAFSGAEFGVEALQPSVIVIGEE